MRNTTNPRARSEDLVIQTMTDETLVYDLTNHQAHCLNETAGFVWSQCTGEASIDQISASFEQRFGQAVDADLVRLAIAQLDERKLLHEMGFDGTPMPDRRQAIKRIGLASALAVPVIASIVTPAHAFHALSCNIPCTSPGSCFVVQCGNFCNPAGLCLPNP